MGERRRRELPEAAACATDLHGLGIPSGDPIDVSCVSHPSVEETGCADNHLIKSPLDAWDDGWTAGP